MAVDNPDLNGDWGGHASIRVITANFSVVDLYRMMRTKGFAEGLTLRAYSTDRACMACAGQYQRNLL